MWILFMVFGCAGILGGIFGKTFYKADIETGAPYRQKSSTWSGRLTFIVVGAFLLALGVKFFFEAYR
ncbi:MAG: hypothetical protein WCC27_19595 [Acidobacteriaceae bacterium]